MLQIACSPYVTYLSFNFLNLFTNRLYLDHLPSQICLHHLHLVLQFALICPQQLDSTTDTQTRLSSLVGYVEVSYLSSSYPT